MKKGILKSVIVLMALAFATMTMTSCNKGYGCPGEFSVDFTLNVPSSLLP